MTGRWAATTSPAPPSTRASDPSTSTLIIVTIGASVRPPGVVERAGAHGDHLGDLLLEVRLQRGARLHGAVGLGYGKVEPAVPVASPIATSSTYTRAVAGFRARLLRSSETMAGTGSNAIAVARSCAVVAMMGVEPRVGPHVEERVRPAPQVAATTDGRGGSKPSQPPDHRARAT